MPHSLTLTQCDDINIERERERDCIEGPKFSFRLTLLSDPKFPLIMWHVICGIIRKIGFTTISN